MKILHPNNTEYLSLSKLKNHNVDGYYNIISTNEKERLNYFLHSFEDFRKDYKDRIFDDKLYANLPFSVNSLEWKERQKDVKIIDKIIKNKQNLTILDIGSWNGWLSNYLSKKGHNLVATNMFINKFDGLKASKNYQTDFISLQLMADEIYRIQQKFDIIIFNRNWAYFKNKQKVFNDVKQLLTKNGIVIFTGLRIYKDSEIIKTNLKNVDTKFKEKYKIPLFYKPSKGYLNYIDTLFFKKNNIKLIHYQLFKNFIKKVFYKKALSYYGIFQNTLNDKKN